MDLVVFEDQTGMVVFPKMKPGRDEGIVRKYFNNRVDLYLQKEENRLEIVCYVRAGRDSTRDLGYYLRYTDFYNENSFTNFKKEANDVLNELELVPRSKDIENTIFTNIERFDKSQYSIYKDFDAVTYALSENEYLEYDGGSIEDIPYFCKNILKNSVNLKLVVSSEKSKLGNINILRNKRFEGSLNPTSKTEQILEKYRKKVNSIKRKKVKEIAIDKIKQGILLKKEGEDILLGGGYSRQEINKIINKLTEEDVSPYIESNEPDISIIEKRKQKLKNEMGTGNKNGYLPRFFQYLQYLLVALAIIILVLMLLKFAGILPNLGSYSDTKQSENLSITNTNNTTSKGVENRIYESIPNGLNNPRWTAQPREVQGML